MVGNWMVQKMEIPSVHKIAKIFGKNEFEPSISKKLFFFLENVLIPTLAILFTIAYWSIAIICYFNYLD